jgi:hypothetical protein
MKQGRAVPSDPMLQAAPWHSLPDTGVGRSLGSVDAPERER